MIALLTHDHLVYLRAGALVALLAAALTRRAPRLGPDLAAIGIAAVLVHRGQEPTRLLVIVVLVVAASHLGMRHTPVVLAVATAAALWWALPSPPALRAIGALGALALVPLVLRPTHRVVGALRLVPIGAVGACLAATAAGGPDTEGSMAALAALTLAVALVRPSPHRGPSLVGVGPIVVIAWVAVVSYVGRPAGLPAAVVALAALVLVLALSAGPAARLPPWIPIAATAAAGATALAAARTIGLVHHAGPAEIWTAVALSAPMLAAARWAWRDQRPASTRS